MGSWNETCYISKLPIEWSEDIVVILLHETIYKSGPKGCYPTECYVPLGLPIYGKYDDYGGIENITNAKDVLEYLSSIEINYVSEDGEKVIPMKFTPENLEENIRLLLETDMSYQVVQGYHSLKITGFMVKRTLYERLLNHVKNRSNDGKTYKQWFEKEVIDMFRQIHEENKKIKDELAKHPEREEVLKMILETNNIRVRTPYARMNTVDYPSDIMPFLIERFIDKNSDKDKDYIIEIMFFKRCLTLLRMGYYNSTIGPAEPERLIQCEVAKFILEEAQRTVDEYRSINNDDATDEEILSTNFF